MYLASAYGATSQTVDTVLRGIFFFRHEWGLGNPPALLAQFLKLAGIAARRSE